MHFRHENLNPPIDYFANANTVKEVFVQGISALMQIARDEGMTEDQIESVLSDMIATNARSRLKIIHCKSLPGISENS